MKHDIKHPRTMSNTTKIKIKFGDCADIPYLDRRREGNYLTFL